MGFCNLCMLHTCKDTCFELQQLFFYLKQILTMQVESCICVLNRVCKHREMIPFFCQWNCCLKFSIRNLQKCHCIIAGSAGICCSMISEVLCIWLKFPKRKMLLLLYQPCKIEVTAKWKWNPTCYGAVLICIHLPFFFFFLSMKGFFWVLFVTLKPGKFVKESMSLWPSQSF